MQKIVSNDEEFKNIYIYHERSAINTLSKKLVDFRENRPKETLSIRSTTLEKIISESPFKEKKINLISIDIENHEYEALKDFNFEKYKVDVIVTEWTDTTQRKLEIYNQSIETIQNSKIYDLFIKNNYKLVNWVNSDLIFVRKDFNLNYNN